MGVVCVEKGLFFCRVGPLFSSTKNVLAFSGMGGEGEKIVPVSLKNGL